MKQNNNFSPLPFYDDVRLQNHRQSYAYGAIYPLVMPSNFIIPFQLFVERKGSEPTKVKDINIIDATGDEEAVYIITDDIERSGLEIVENVNENVDAVVYKGYFPLSFPMEVGCYYMQIDTNNGTFYSDVFCVKKETENLLKIEWWDDENFEMDAGTIVYENGYRNRLYFCAEIGKPEYQFEEEIEKRDGYVFPIKQISEKTYKFVILAPEYLLDAMRFIRMSDYVVITDKFGRVYHCDTFLLTAKWQTQGDLASVEIEFETDTVAKKIGRQLVKKVAAAGDYNNDFDNDYNNN